MIQFDAAKGQMRRCVALMLSLVMCLLLLTSCGEQDGGSSDKKDYVLNEDTFFLVMTNMQYYPEQYVGSNIEYDCFTYELQDVNGQSYICGVRKCSAGFGCTCGKDTIIGFILNDDEPLPEPRNQSEDSVEKTWVHLKGTLPNAEKTTITIHSYLPDGTIDPEKNEQIQFLTFDVASCELIEDYANLKYYVTK